MGDDGAMTAAYRRRQQEEEEMTTYSAEDLNQYEFKVVRSVSGAFGNPQNFQRLLQEEGRAGWELLEKLDNQRVRFKRPLSARERDSQLPAGVDPYRSYVGMPPLRFALWLLLGIVVMLAVICFFWTWLSGTLAIHYLQP